MFNKLIKFFLISLIFCFKNNLRSFDCDIVTKSGCSEGYECVPTMASSITLTGKCVPSSQSATRLIGQACDANHPCAGASEGKAECIRNTNGVLACFGISDKAYCSKDYECKSGHCDGTMCREISDPNAGKPGFVCKAGNICDEDSECIKNTQGVWACFGKAGTVCDQPWKCKSNKCTNGKCE